MILGMGAHYFFMSSSLIVPEQGHFEIHTILLKGTLTSFFPKDIGKACR